MLFLKFGIMAMFHVQTVLLASVKMEISNYTFKWEDAEARCGRQGHVLTPGRRYRAKLIKSLMEEKNVQSLWLHGWRSVSDTTPDADGKLRTLKVDFSRTQNKKIKMVCQLGSAFYDPLYLAKSTGDARDICKKDKTILAHIKTEEDIQKVTEAILIDKPHWVDSISSQGSKIKQCLVAQRVGDDLKYKYEDCSKEYNIICVTDKNLISTFSPLISLKIARYDEFKEEIERHVQAMLSTFDLFEPVTSMTSFLDVSSTDTMIQATSAQVPQSTTTEVPLEVTPAVKPTDTMTPKQPVEVTSTETPSLMPSKSQAAVATSKLLTEMTTSDALAESLSKKIPEETKSEILWDVTKTTIDIETTSTEETQMVTSSKKDSEIVKSVVSMEVTSHVMSTAIIPTVPKITDGSKTSFSVDLVNVDVTSSSEMMPKSSETSANLVVFPFSSTLESRQIIKSDGLEEYSPSSTQQSTGISIVDVQYQGESISVDVTGSMSQLKSTKMQQSDMFHQISPSETTMSEDSSYVSMSKDDQSIYMAHSVIEKDEQLMRTEPLSLEPSSTAFSMAKSSTSVIDDYSDHEFSDYSETADDLDMDTKVRSQTSVTKPDYTTETGPVIFATPAVSEPFMSKVADTSSYIHRDTQSGTSPSFTMSSVYVDTPQLTPASPIEDLMPKYTSSSHTLDFVSSKYDDIPDYFSTDSSESTIAMAGLIPSESSTMSYKCTVIDSTSICPDTSAATDKLDSAVFAYTTKPLMKETTFTTPSSSSSSFIFDTDKDSESSEPYIPMSVPSSTELIPSSSIYYDEYFDEKLPDKTVIDYDDDVEYVGKTDEEIPGQIDIDEGEDENEVGNDSVNTGEVVGKKAEEDEEGIEVGLWVAFGILIALVLIALILALYLYRRRKMQKSKDISAANGAAAAGASAGETVELRDSRSPSRENGAPRESTTYKDPAYDI